MGSSTKEPADWEQYEDQIFAKLSEEYPHHKIEKNVHVFGQFSKIDRQIDVVVNDTIVGEPVTAIVDCKYFSSNIDIGVVDKFIGLVNDIQAEVGILITNHGYSEAAMNRARNDRGIRIVIAEFSRLSEYEFAEICHVCPEAHDNIPGSLWIDNLYHSEGLTDDFETAAVALMHCDVCASHHLKCAKCGSITAVYEMEYGNGVECEGGCGSKFKLIEEPERDGQYSYSVKLM